MIKVLTVGDQHLDSMAPSSRKDDYLASLQAKFLEIRDIVKDQQISAVIFLGDMFHKQDAHRVPYFVTNWMLEYFDGYPSTCRKFLTMGNHDVKATVANWRRQPIGTLVAAEVVQPLWCDATDSNPWGEQSYNFTANDEHLTQVEISGKLFSYDADLPLNRSSYYSSPKERHGFHIQAIHTACVPVKETVFGHFSTIEDVALAVPPDRRPDLYVCGHLHEYYGVFEWDGLKCMNLGALARGSIDEYNLSRQVKVGLISVEGGPSGYKCGLSEIALKSMKPAADVFLTEAFNQKKQRTQDLELLASMLTMDNINNEFKLLNPDDSLEIILKKQAVRPSVRTLLTDMIRQTKQEMG